MGEEGNYKFTGRGKSNKPVNPPTQYLDEIRFSEVDVSLYSEFSDDDDKLTNDVKSKLDDSNEKDMFSKFFNLTNSSL